MLSKYGTGLGPNVSDRCTFKQLFVCDIRKVATVATQPSPMYCRMVPNCDSHQLSSYGHISTAVQYSKSSTYSKDSKNSKYSK